MNRESNIASYRKMLLLHTRVVRVIETKMIKKRKEKTRKIKVIYKFLAI